jgi:hypothetical protein
MNSNNSSAEEVSVMMVEGGRRGEGGKEVKRMREIGHRIRG